MVDKIFREKEGGGDFRRRLIAALIIISGVGFQLVDIGTAISTMARSPSFA